MARVQLEQSEFGVVDGQSVRLFTFRSSSGLSITLCNLGCTIIKALVPSKQGPGDVADVVLGYDSVASIQSGLRNFGSIVGRYANRIAFGKFQIDDQSYSLPLNNGPNHLHGGPQGFCDKVFTVHSTAVHSDRAEVSLTYTSPDGEQGYPGELHVTATFSLDYLNRFEMKFNAVTNKATIVNLCNHAYWNLAGHNSPAPSSLLSHQLEINASQFTPNDDSMIPFGHLASVAGTPFDFRSSTAIGAHIAELYNDRKSGGGYDLNFCIDRSSASDATELVLAARLRDPVSGRSMSIHTSAPGVQLYSGNWLNTTGKDGCQYQKYGGVCLETQHFPNSPNVPAFPSPLLRPGEVYSHTAVHTFEW